MAISLLDSSTWRTNGTTDNNIFQRGEKEMTDKPVNPCNDCKVEYRHCPLYPKACKRFDEYAKAVYTKDTREIVCENGCWYLMETGTWRIMWSGPLPVPEEYKALEAK